MGEIVNSYNDLSEENEGTAWNVEVDGRMTQGVTQ
jgi:hypothetical protein